MLCNRLFTLVKNANNTKRISYHIHLLLHLLHLPTPTTPTYTILHPSPPDTTLFIACTVSTQYLHHTYTTPTHTYTTPTLRLPTPTPPLLPHIIVIISYSLMPIHLTPAMPTPSIFSMCHLHTFTTISSAHHL